MQKSCKLRAAHEANQLFKFAKLNSDVQPTYELLTVNTLDDVRLVIIIFDAARARSVTGSVVARRMPGTADHRPSVLCEPPIPCSLSAEAHRPPTLQGSASSGVACCACQRSFETSWRSSLLVTDTKALQGRKCPASALAWKSKLQRSSFNAWTAPLK